MYYTDDTRFQGHVNTLTIRIYSMTAELSEYAARGEEALVAALRDVEKRRSAGSVAL
jgi:hypothetical protein